jgi:hypothetical protein
MSVFTHHGIFDAHSRQSRALRFIESYQQKLETLDFSSPSSDFFAANSIFHNTKGDVYISGPHIWACHAKELVAFDQARHELVEARVVTECEDREVIYGEFVTNFRLKGIPEEIAVPRFMVWIVAAAEQGKGTNGLQIQEASVFWDTGIIDCFIKERKERATEKDTRNREARKSQRYRQHLSWLRR